MKIFLPNEDSIISNFSKNRFKAGLVANIVLTSLLIVLFIIGGMIDSKVKKANANYLAETDYDHSYITAKEFDKDNDIDDRISISQDYALKLVTKMFSHTTSTFKRNIEKLEVEFTDNGYKDLLANIHIIRMDKTILTKKNIIVTSCSFRQGVPLVLDYVLHDSKDSVSSGDVFTMQINIAYIGSVASGSPIFSKNLKFTVDVIYDPYTQEMEIDRISRWEESL